MDRKKKMDNLQASNRFSKCLDLLSNPDRNRTILEHKSNPGKYPRTFRIGKSLANQFRTGSSKIL